MRERVHKGGSVDEPSVLLSRRGPPPAPWAESDMLQEGRAS